MLTNELVLVGNESTCSLSVFFKENAENTVDFSSRLLGFPMLAVEILAAVYSCRLGPSRQFRSSLGGYTFTSGQSSGSWLEGEHFLSH